MKMQRIKTASKMTINDDSDPLDDDTLTVTQIKQSEW